MKQLLQFITLVCVFLACASARGQGQTTYYYSQEKIIDPTTKQAASGEGNRAGFFITFNAKGCYDSDRDGYDVGNGFRQEVARGGDFVTYIGESYWGDARYVVNADKSRINIHTPDRILVYVRCQPPSGRATSSLIRKNSPASSPASPPVPSVIPGSDDNYAGKAAMYLAHYRKLDQSLQEAFRAYERIMAGSYDSSRAGMAKAIYDIQANMRAWRSDALRDGVTIPISPWETARPSIGTVHYENKPAY